MEVARRRAIHEAIVRLADGERSGIGVLLDELWPVLVAFARRGVGNADAEDVAQDVFVRLCARAAEFDRARDGLTWALGIAAYEVLTWRQRRSRRREVSDEALTQVSSDAAAQPDELLLQRELDVLLTSAIADLPEADRAVLTSLQQHPMPAAARKRRQRALERLRNLWRTLYES